MMGELLAHDELAGEGTAGRRAVVAVDAAVGQRRELPAVVLLTCRAHVAAEAGVDDVADGDGVADCESSHLRADLGHGPGALMPRHERVLGALGAGGSLRVLMQCVQVAVADAAEIGRASWRAGE